MKLLKLVLVLSGALLIGGAAGFFVCYLTKSQPLEQANAARRVHADSLAGVLADSITYYEAWIPAQIAADVKMITDSKEEMRRKYAGHEHLQGYKDGEQAMNDLLKQAESGMPYVVVARAHLDWMKQEKAWIESLR